MNKAEYLVGEFVDYKGQTRKFVMAVVSGDYNGYIKMYSSSTIYGKYEYPKCMSIGVAVCLPEDEFDLELGKKIAYGKAMNTSDHVIVASMPSMLGGITAKALLEQEAKYFANDPGKYLKGYNERAAKYKKRKEIESFIADLDTEANLAFERLVQMEDAELEKFAEAVNYIRVGA